MASTGTAQRPQTDDTDLDLTIGPDPHRRGRHRARLTHYGRPVWALIADLQGNGWDAAQTAEYYDLPEAAVQAAIDYYRSDPKYIDAVLLLNRESFEG